MALFDGIVRLSRLLFVRRYNPSIDSTACSEPLGVSVRRAVVRPEAIFVMEVRAKLLHKSGHLTTPTTVRPAMQMETVSPAPNHAST